MTYYVAPHGSDAGSNPGTDPAQPLRSLTTAIDRIAAVHGESVSPAETVEMAAGSYGPAFGERFPILVPANVEIRGADRDTTIMEYDFSGGVDTCIDLHGSLSDITLSPVTEHSCNYSLRVSRDDATVEQPRPNVSDDAGTVQIAPGDMSDDLSDARTMTEVGTKLDLARAYVDMGDPSGARSILEEVLDEGDEGQRQQARQLLDSLPS